jgi:hypothetical protein
MINEGAKVALDHGIKRSSKWEGFRKKFLQKNSICAVCGGIEKLEAHHIQPFHFCIMAGRPDLELDERNLITLCESENNNHHLLIGHNNDFRSSNPNVIEDCIKFKNLNESQIKLNEEWIAEEKNKPKELNEMSDEDKIKFKKMLDEKYPLTR